MATSGVTRERMLAWTNDRTEFYTRFDLTTLVIGDLEKNDVFGPGVIVKLKADKYDDHAKKEIILNAVRQQDVEAFLKFCKILIDDKQRYILTEVWGLTDVDIESIQKQRIAGAHVYNKGISKSKAEDINLHPENYPMNAKPRGRAIIVNFTKFLKKYQFEESETDVENLTTLFRDLGFEVKAGNCIWRNLTQEELKVEIEKERKRQEEGDYDAFVMFLMSHGCNGYIYDTELTPIDIMNTIVAPFNANNAPSLIDKPKMFFIDACRRDIPEDVEPVNMNRISTPGAAMRDMLITFATYQGAYAESDGGSVYAQEVTSVFSQRHNQDDVLTMLTKVNDNVYQRYPEFQIPEPTHSLKKKIYLLSPQ